jgi:hypothetical protein
MVRLMNYNRCCTATGVKRARSCVAASGCVDKCECVSAPQCLETPTVLPARTTFPIGMHALHVCFAMVAALHSALDCVCVQAPAHVTALVPEGGPPKNNARHPVLWVATQSVQYTRPVASVHAAAHVKNSRTPLHADVLIGASWRQCLMHTAPILWAP